MRFCQPRSHEQNLEWALTVAAGEKAELMGMTGRSLFFDAPNFDTVYDMMPETMHLMDGGFMKNTCGRAFNSGSGPQTRPGYRKTNIATLNGYVL